MLKHIFLIISAIAIMLPAGSISAGPTDTFKPRTLQKGSAPKDKTDRASQKSGTSLKPNTGKTGKISRNQEDFLKIIEKAKSLEEIGKAFDAAKFSNKEIKQLVKATKKPPYASKLNTLKRNAEAKAKAGLRSKMAAFKNEKSEFAQKHKQGIQSCLL